VATATNRSYLPWCATALRSCVRATPDRPLTVHLIIDTDVSIAAQRQLSDMLAQFGAYLDVLPLRPGMLGDLPPAVDAHGGEVSCARFLLPDLLPDVDRLIYLDADTLTRSSLAQLWATPLEGKQLAAVCNVVEPAQRTRLLALGVRDPKRYLNSGVLLMDLALMRRRASVPSLLGFIQAEGSRLLWVDQDTLNIVLQDDWQELAPRWNAQNSFWAWPTWASEIFELSELEQARQDPAILHFEGPNLAKPWHYLCRHPYTADYLQASAATPWGAPILEDCTWATRLIRRLPSERQLPLYLRLLAARGVLRRSRE